MKPAIIKTHTKNFENYVNNMDDGLEFWFARDVQHLFGYSKWENFLKDINKAIIACELSGQNTIDHFPDIMKMVNIGSNAKKEIDDFMLSRYACYLIAQNGDPSKEEMNKINYILGKMDPPPPPP